MFALLRTATRKLLGPREDAQRGSIAPVLVLSILLLGFALMGAMRYQGAKVDFARQQATAQAMGRLQKALWQFVGRNYRLPCPANPTTGDGLEDPPGGGPCNFPTAANYGVVPWKTLGLQQTDALDAWGHQFGLAVTGQGATILTGGSPLPYQYQIPAPGTDSVCVGGDCTASATFGYAYALISFGPDGAGAYLTSGKQLPVPLGTAEAPNAQVAAFTATSPAAFAIAPYDNGNSNPASRFDDVLVYETSEQLCANVNFNKEPAVSAWWVACSPNTNGVPPAGVDTATLLEKLGGSVSNQYLGATVSAGSAANALAIDTSASAAPGTTCAGTACTNANGQFNLKGGVGAVSLTDASGNAVAMSVGNANAGAYGDWIGADNTSACSSCTGASQNPGYIVPNQTLTYRFASSYTSFAFVDYLVDGGMTVKVTALAGPTLATAVPIPVNSPIYLSNGSMTTRSDGAGGVTTTPNTDPRCLGPAGQSLALTPIPWLQTLLASHPNLSQTTIPAASATNYSGVSGMTGYPPPLSSQQWGSPIALTTTTQNYVNARDYQFANVQFLDDYGNPQPFNILQFELEPYVGSNGTDAAPYHFGMLFEGVKACPTYAANTATIGGTVTAGDTVTLTLANPGIWSSPVTLPAYTVKAGDTATSIAGGLVSLINSSATLRPAAPIFADNIVAATNASGVTTTDFGGKVNVLFEGDVTLGAKTVVSASISKSGGGKGTETVTFSPSSGALGTSPGAVACDMRGSGVAPGFSPATDQWWNPTTYNTMDCSLQSGYNLK